MAGIIPFWLLLSVAFLIGLALGSFTTCIVYRVPRGLSIWRSDKNQAAYRSFCPTCNNALTARDLVPIFSWLFLCGTCRHCGKAIGLSYLLTEIFVTALVMVIVSVHGLTATGLLLCALIPVLGGIWAFFVLKPRL